MEMFEKQFSGDGFRGGLNDKNNILLAIETRLNRTAIEIFRLYRHNLKRAQINYVVPAVWGIKENGELDPEQKEIFKLVVPLMEAIFEILQICKLSQRHKFATEYLIRGMVIMKIVYMIECYNNRKHLINSDDRLLQENALYHLENVEPMGRA